MKRPIETYRQMGPEQLRNEESDLRDQLFRMRFQMAMGHTESVKKLRELRRNVARVKTLLNERQAGKAEGAGGSQQ